MFCQLKQFPSREDKIHFTERSITSINDKPSPPSYIHLIHFSIAKLEARIHVTFEYFHI